MTMEIRTQVQSIERARGDLLVVNEFEGIKKPGGATGAVDKALDGMLSKIAKEEGFTGKEEEIVLFPTFGKIPAKRVLLVGLGNKKDFSHETVRRAAGRTIREAKRVQAKKIVSILHGAGIGGLKPREAACALVEGLLLSDYQFTKYKKEAVQKAKKTQIKEVLIPQLDNRSIKVIEQGITEGRFRAEAVIFARDLVNEPSSEMTPVKLVEIARLIANKNSRVSVKIYGRSALERMGAGGILGVARGSAEEPYLIHFIYKPKIKAKKIAICGKGVTFDSGGISIKPSDAMYIMKSDMAGGASIFGLFSKIREIEPKIEVHGIVGVCENMPSGQAIKPGDIVKTINGKTIEILHTDAEGRVVLADTLAYASKQKPDFIVDLATLTGSCRVALGEEVAGLMGNDLKLMGKIKEAARESGELVWELPLMKEYAGQIKSDIADVKNITQSRYAGVITAGLFLKEFISEGQPWAHLDIAGPAFAEKQTLSYVPIGGTGFGVRTLIDLLKKI